MYSQELNFAKEIALKAGNTMRKYFDSGLAAREKADKTIVTRADEEINTMVIEEISAHFPEHSIIGEEESLETESEMIWLCDPVDGTVPFFKGVPVSVFSLALIKDGTPVVGVVYDPFEKRLYLAEKGKGSYLNDTLINVSNQELNYQALINIEWWPEAEYDIDTALHEVSVSTKAYVLHLGSVISAGALVASGKYEACVFAGTKGKNVDIAALKVIVEEAGGKVTDLFGKEQRYDGDLKGALVSNGIVHEPLLEALKPYV